MKYKMSENEFDNFVADIDDYNRELTGMFEYESIPPKMWPGLDYDVITHSAILHIRKSYEMDHAITCLTDPIVIKEG